MARIKNCGVRFLKKNITMVILALPIVALMICLVLLLPSAPTEPIETSAPDSQLQSQNCQLVINEICAKNETILADGEGRNRDYIELYNPGPAFSLAGLCIGDGKTVSEPFGDVVIPQNGYLVVFLADELTGFALSATGADQIQLLDGHGKILLQASTMAMEADQVMIYENGSYTLTFDASPGFPNDEAGVSMFRYGAEETEPKIVISEVLLENMIALPDEKLRYSDVVELQNISSETVDLSNYFLADSIENRKDYRLPAVQLAPGEFVLIWCDRGNYVSENGFIHADFALSHGETLYLTDVNDRHVHVTVQSGDRDCSISRQADGSYQMGAASLGFTNDEAGIAAFLASRMYTDAPLVISEICAKNNNILADKDGRNRDYIELYNSGPAISLAGMRLGNGRAFSEPFGDVTIPQGGYYVVFLGDDVTGFSLGATGADQIQLLDSQGNILLQIITMAMDVDQVMIYENGSYTLTFDASPGFPNDEAGVSMFRYGTEETDPKIIISEVLLENALALPDEKLQYSDVVELRNISNETIDLSTYFLADSLADRLRYRLPAVQLAPGEFVLIWCDRGNYVSENGFIHADFALSHGETLYLTDENDRHVQLTVESGDRDRSLSRQADGSYQMGAVSLGFANDEAGIAAFADSRMYKDSPLLITEVLLSSAGVSYQGRFYDIVEIYNRSQEMISLSGWYLSDGGDPFEYMLPDYIMAPGEYIVIICSQETTGFALSEKDVLRLTAPDHRGCVPVSCAGGSVSLVQRNGEGVYVAMNATPGLENTEQAYLQYLQQQYGQGLMISELMSSNQSYLPGAYSTTCDWIELYNASNQDILLSNYWLTDDVDFLWKYQLPEKTLKPGQRIVIFLSESGKNLLSGYSVLPFNLSAAGEELCLTDVNGIVDYVQVPALGADVAYGRPEKNILFDILENPTPGKANAAVVSITDMPVTLTPQGVYNDVAYLDVDFFGEGKIYYTTDSTAPDITSLPYTGPIRITKTTVFRVICVADGKRPSKILDLTYVLNEDDKLPVVTLVAEPDAMFSWENGIYMAGPNASSNEPYYGANFWKDIEVPATVSLFEKDGSGFSSGCGIKIFGGWSRGEKKKSLACFFRAEYGASELDYRLFGEEGLDTYEAFVLRNGGQDVFWGRMRDVLITSLVAEQTTVAVQKYRPVVVYINGQYFGVHYIREKLNENYVAGNYNVKKEDVILCEKSGNTSSAYRALINYAMTHDLSDPVHYEYICSQIDVDNYIDFMLAQIYIGNTDSDNVRFFKTPQGKWTWILYDTDMSFHTSSYNSFSVHLNPEYIGTKDFTSKTLAVRLLKNPEFKEKFLRRLAWQLENIWSVENINARIDLIKGMIAEDVVKDCKRWGQSYSYWESSVEILRLFASRREAKLVAHAKTYFGLTDEQMIEYGFHI